MRRGQHTEFKAYFKPLKSYIMYEQYMSDDIYYSLSIILNLTHM